MYDEPEILGDLFILVSEQRGYGYKTHILSVILATK